MELLLKSITCIDDIRKFKKGDIIKFEKQLTLLAGDNGVGKSTILDAIRCKFKIQDISYLKPDEIDKAFEFEMTDNVVCKYIDFHAEDKKYAGSFGDDIMLQIAQGRQSSGESTLSLLLSKQLDKIENSLILLDEYGRGSSKRREILLVKILTNLLNKNNQIIVITHNDYILKNENYHSEKDNVGLYYLEERKYTSFEYYEINENIKFMETLYGKINSKGKE